MKNKTQGFLVVTLNVSRAVCTNFSLQQLTPRDRGGSEGVGSGTQWCVFTLER